MKYNYDAARAACAAHSEGEKVLAYQEREMIPLDSAIDDAQDGRLGESVKAFANGLPNFWEAENGDAARDAAQAKALAALRLAQASLDSAIVTAAKAGRIVVWETNDGSGVEYKDGAKEALASAHERVTAVYLPLLAGTGWETNPAGILPCVDDVHVGKIIRSA